MNSQNKIEWERINLHESISHFTSKQDNQKIYLKKWHAKYDSEKEKVIILLHDIGKYHNHFRSLVKWYQERNNDFTFIALDFVGHGLSSGTRGHFDQFDNLVEDVNHFFMHEERGHEHEWYVIADGVGGLVLLDLINKYPEQFSSKINGIILSNFIFEFEDYQIGKWLNWRVPRLISHFQIEFKTHNHNLSSKKNDSLIVPKLTLISKEEIKHKLKLVYRDAYFLDWPILVLTSGDGDKNSINKLSFFLRGIKKNLLKEKHYSNLTSDLYNDQQRELAFHDLEEWINTHEKKD
jgi:alpha-beta hydrolase superfamily lysophospholipase